MPKYELEQVIIENFKNVQKLDIMIPKGSYFLVGKNGMGKSTVIDAIIFALQSRYILTGGDVDAIGLIRSGAEKSKITLKLTEKESGIKLTVVRTITKAGNVRLKIDQSEGDNNFKQNFLDTIFDAIALDPRTFMRLSPKQQALAIGLDTSIYDEQKKLIFDERTIVNRDVKNLGMVLTSNEDIEEIEPVDVYELNNRKQLAKKEWEEYETEIQKRVQLEEDKEKATREYEAAKQKLGMINNVIEMRLKEKLVEPKSNVDELDRQIMSASEINQKAIQWKEISRIKNEYEEAKVNADKMTKDIGDIELEKVEYIKSKSKELPFKNMIIDESGGLLFGSSNKDATGKIDYRPLNENYYSAGECLKIITLLLTAKQPDLDLILIRDANIFDEDNIKMLSETGKTIIFEYVGNKELEGKTCLLLTEEAPEAVEEDNDSRPELKL